MQMICLKNYGYEILDGENFVASKYDIDLIFCKFNKEDKQIIINANNCFLTMQELKAINAKVQQLGWEE